METLGQVGESLGAKFDEYYCKLVSPQTAGFFPGTDGFTWIEHGGFFNLIIIISSNLGTTLCRKSLSIWPVCRGAFTRTGGVFLV